MLCRAAMGPTPRPNKSLKIRESKVVPFLGPTPAMIFFSVKFADWESTASLRQAAFMTGQGETRLGNKGGSEAIIQRDTGRQEAIPDILK